MSSQMSLQLQTKKPNSNTLYPVSFKDTGCIIACTKTSSYSKKYTCTVLFFFSLFFFCLDTVDVIYTSDLTKVFDKKVETFLFHLCFQLQSEKEPAFKHLN